MSQSKPPQVPSRAAPSAVDAFLAKASKTSLPARSGRARMVFALDATMSRQPTWDLAQSLQAKMFEAAAHHGGLEVQLVYYRGAGECRASAFVSQARGLIDAMARIDCRSGTTQIGKVLRHVRDEGRPAGVTAFIFVGDAVEEAAASLYGVAGELGLFGIKGFMFQEGENIGPAQVFQEIARLTGGAYGVFDASAPARLAALLAAAAAYAAGGRSALERQALDGHGAAKALLGQMR